MVCSVAGFLNTIAVKFLSGLCIRSDLTRKFKFSFVLFFWLQWFFPESTVAFENEATANPTCVILGVVLRVRLVHFWGSFGPTLERNARFWKSPSQNTWFLKKDVLIYFFGVPPRTPRRVQTPIHKTECIITFLGCPRDPKWRSKGTLKWNKTAPTL